MWLRDFLPQKFPTARIFLFGYNSNVAFGTSTAGVNEQANNLLNRLKLKRRVRCAVPTWPLCRLILSTGCSRSAIDFYLPQPRWDCGQASMFSSFWSHIPKAPTIADIAKALVFSKLDDTYQGIRAATYGIAFFGTPHQGGKFAGLGDVAYTSARAILQNPKNSFMEALRKDSLFADSIVQNFRHQLEDYHILSFFETLSFKNLGVVCFSGHPMRCSSQSVRSSIGNQPLLDCQEHERSRLR